MFSLNLKAAQKPDFLGGSDFDLIPGAEWGNLLC
jgi:hypothetical protein